MKTPSSFLVVGVLALLLSAVAACGRTAATEDSAVLAAGSTPGGSCPAGQVSLCANVCADNTGKAGASDALQSCIDAQAASTYLKLPGGVYKLDHQLTLNRGVKLGGNNNAQVTLKPVNHNSSIDFPDMPNTSGIRNEVTVDFSAAEGPIDMGQYMAPKAPSPVVIMSEKKSTTTQTFAYGDNGRGQLFVTKGFGDPDTFQYWEWDDTRIMLKHEVHSKGGTSEKLYNRGPNDEDHPADGLVYAHRFVYPYPHPSSIVTSPNQTGKVFAPHSCKPTGELVTTWQNRNVVLGHYVIWMGGDLGFQDVVIWKTQIAYPANGAYELFKFSKRWGMVHWSSWNADGTQQTSPNGSLYESKWNKVLAKDSADYKKYLTLPNKATNCK